MFTQGLDYIANERMAEYMRRAEHGRLLKLARSEPRAARTVTFSQMVCKLKGRLASMGRPEVDTPRPVTQPLDGGQVTI